MYKGNRRDFAIHRADTDTLLPQALKCFCGLIIEGEEMPSSEEIK